jgi:preprotein translocase subunit YajC
VATLILIAAMFVLLYLFLIRPQRQRMQAQQRLISSAAPGDEILTAGGIYGIVEEVDEDDDLIVEIAEGIRVRVARKAVAHVEKPGHELEEPEALEPAGELEEPEQAGAGVDGGRAR